MEQCPRGKPASQVLVNSSPGCIAVLPCRVLAHAVLCCAVPCCSDMVCRQITGLTPQVTGAAAAAGGAHPYAPQMTGGMPGGYTPQVGGGELTGSSFEGGGGHTHASPTTHTALCGSRGPFALLLLRVRL